MGHAESLLVATMRASCMSEQACSTDVSADAPAVGELWQMQRVLDDLRELLPEVVWQVLKTWSQLLVACIFHFC